MHATRHLSSDAAHLFRCPTHPPIHCCAVLAPHERPSEFQISPGKQPNCIIRTNIFPGEYRSLLKISDFILTCIDTQINAQHSQNFFSFLAKLLNLIASPRRLLTCRSKLAYTVYRYIVWRYSTFKRSYASQSHMWSRFQAFQLQNRSRLFASAPAAFRFLPQTTGLWTFVQSARYQNRPLAAVQTPFPPAFAAKFPQHSRPTSQWAVVRW